MEKTNAAAEICTLELWVQVNSYIHRISNKKDKMFKIQKISRLSFIEAYNG